MLRHAKNQKGFTLIEMLIGISIFSIGMMALATLQMLSVRNSTNGQLRTQATRLAQQQIEILENQSLSSSGSLLNPGSYPTVVSDSNNPIDENGNAGGVFTRSYTVDSFSAYARSISVTVSWNHWGSQNQVTLNTLTRGNDTW